MFKELEEGKTHYQNDGCGEPAHNDVKKEEWSVKYLELLRDWRKRNLGPNAIEQGTIVVFRKIIRDEVTAAEQRMEKEKESILDSLLDMYGQYCGDGHDFMSAGERACLLLERHSIAKFDRGGKIIEPEQV